MQALSLQPLSPHDDALLSDFLALEGDLEALAAKHNRALSDLVPWATSPTINPYLHALDHFLAFRETRRQVLALNKLSRSLEEATDPVEIRRTATVILQRSHTLLYAPARRPQRTFVNEFAPPEQVARPSGRGLAAATEIPATHCAAPTPSRSPAHTCTATTAKEPAPLPSRPAFPRINSAATHGPASIPRPRSRSPTHFLAAADR